MRNLVILLVSFIIGYLTMAAGEAMVHFLYPDATRDVIFSLSEMRAYIQGMPFYVHLLHLLAWVTGVTFGALITKSFLKTPQIWPFLMLTVLFLGVVLWQTMHFRYPYWIIAASVVSIPTAIYLIQQSGRWGTKR